MYTYLDIFVDDLWFFFSRTNELISTKLDTKLPWVKRIHVCSTVSPFAVGDITKYWKYIDDTNDKTSFRTTGLISTELGTKQFT